ncbi:hypothetical protein BJ508DRAFT_302453 [Ascobolus immersus RN42]|uniref:Uncharacterized protein n=1 Tax=Ascobolus immersus RN42 TaxID=1160509 RepID=A0A3N4IIW8_ASCIM|nr:hypothetical protein BJ508DRAFT_302453 [Ascobolus immersus RN42]
MAFACRWCQGQYVLPFVWGNNMVSMVDMVKMFRQMPPPHQLSRLLSSPLVNIPDGQIFDSRTNVVPNHYSSLLRLRIIPIIDFIEFIPYFSSPQLKQRQRSTKQTSTSEVASQIAIESQPTETHIVIQTHFQSRCTKPTCQSVNSEMSVKQVPEESIPSKPTAPSGDVNPKTRSREKTQGGAARSRQKIRLRR